MWGELQETTCEQEQIRWYKYAALVMWSDLTNTIAMFFPILKEILTPSLCVFTVTY